MRVIIDRFEGDFAVVELEDLSTLNVPKILFKGGKEGDVFDIIYNKDESVKREDNINELMNKLFI